MHPDGVLFDLDHTIFRGTTLNMEPALRLLIDEYRMSDVGIETMLERCDRLSQDLYRRSRDSGFELSIQHLCRFLCSEFGYDVNIGPKIERKIFDLTYAVEGLEEGAREVLEELEKRQIPRGVLSNNAFSGQTLLHGLDQHSVGHLFTSVLSSADMGVRKPYAGVFRAAAASLGVSAQRTWFVGDSFAADILGAQSAGMTAVWYNHAGEAVPQDPPCAIIHHWREFIDQLPH